MSSTDPHLIPKATSRVGGVAGGDKYIHRDIFFKIANDSFGIYGGEENAMKVARWGERERESEEKDRYIY